MRLRLAAESDLPTILEMSNGEHFGIWGMRKVSPVEVARYAKDGFLFNLDTGSGYLLLENPQGKVIGLSKILSNLAHQYSVASCGIAPEHVGLGYGRLIVEKTIEFIFETLPVVRIEANNLALNSKIRRIIEKCGFTLEGIKRQAWFCHGRLHDQSVYGLLRQEWLNKRLALEIATDGRSSESAN